MHVCVHAYSTYTCLSLKRRGAGNLGKEVREQSVQIVVEEHFKQKKWSRRVVSALALERTRSRKTAEKKRSIDLRVLLDVHF